MDHNTRHRPRLPMRARLATTVGGAAATVSRLAGRGDGSVIGGIISLRLAPDLLSLLAAGRQVVLVTGTNGKTTTTKLITAALAPLGGQIASNIYGANMEAGLTSALSRAPDAPVAVLETDEKYIPAMVQGDQAQGGRAAEPEPRPDGPRGRDLAAGPPLAGGARPPRPDCRVVANADDPLVAWAAGSARQVTWVAAGQRWREDSWCCPNCGAHLQRDGDDWSCKECGLRRPPVSWMLDDDEVIDPAGRATGSTSRCRGGPTGPTRSSRSRSRRRSACQLAPALAELRQVTSVAGRYTQVTRRGCDIRLLLAKNPAGWLEALDVIAPPPAPVLLSVNAQGPDGRDTSWLWDVDFRRLRGRHRPRRRRAQARPGRPARGRRGGVPAGERHRRGGRRGAAVPRRASRCWPTTPRSSSTASPSGGCSDRRRPLRLVWVYPDLLSTYGDRGNALVLERRARLRGLPVEIVEVELRPAGARATATST